MTKRVFIVHGWGGNPEELIHKLLKERFSKLGYEVIIPSMPDTDEPKIEKWIKFLSEKVEKPNKETNFIGHSIGCQAIIRYLETLQEGTKVGRCIFIAGWFNLENLENDEEERIAKPWIEKPINFIKIRNMPKEILVYISSNEYYGYIEENSKMFKEKLGANVIIEKDIGHFTDDEGVKKLSKFVKKIK
ncbi:alpha/beta hydrolase [Candidatus Pacearchaeota archaeon]|nr:alpha/beta hydrolase [Candidatus Pacearchaeota archaeon]